ncbi:MAG: hydrogen gas-evolving membrane-bound hydrogenase subunit E [Geminicoccaceae bacterium]
MAYSANITASDGGSGRPPLAFFAALGAALALTLAFASLLPRVAAGGNIALTLPWAPSLNVELAFRLDGLGLLFALLISGVGVLVVLYASSYLKHHRDHDRLQWLLLAFMLSMLGLVLADNVILLFVFWELTTVTSFLLVGFDHENAKARRSALQALLVTGAGGLALLVGLILLAETAGSYLLSDILTAGGTIKTVPLYTPILVLILIGAFTKSAQFPFHFWLPNAMAAPTPVSAYLHSATMVKAGIYLMARLQPVVGGTDIWFYTLTSIGAITAVWSSMMALRQTDLKLMLAWTTVMALGTLTMFLGSDVRIAVLAAMTFLIVHAFYKCAMFLVIGNVDHSTGTRDIGRLGGLVKAMPMTALIAAAAGLSMAGFPPFLGFIGKELKYEGALAIAEEPYLIAGAAVAANAMMVAVAMTIVIRVFLKPRPKDAEALPREAHEASALMWIGPLFLAAAGLVTGIFPELIAKTVIEPAITGVLREPTSVKLSLWHGVNLPLMLSVVTVMIGTIMFWQLKRVRAGIDAFIDGIWFTGDQVFDACLNGVQRLADFLTARLQSGALGHYLTLVFTVIVLGGGASLYTAGLSFDLDQAAPIPTLAWVVAAIMLGATCVVVVSTSRLLAICALGLIGIGVALIFLMFSAIDVAITQLMVETLFVVLIAIVLLRLPGFAGNAHPGPLGGLRDAAIAIGAGLVVALVTIGVALTPVDLEITRFFEKASYPEAYGRNIVNVILVDFRALDTLGEIAVVVTAALAVIALLKVRPPKPRSGETR